MTQEEILSVLRRLMVDCRVVLLPSFEVRADTRLIEDLGLDSVRMLELLTAVEEEFDVTIDLDDLELDTLNRAGSFAELIDAKVGQLG